MEIASANRKSVDKKLLSRCIIGFDNNWLDFLSAKMVSLSAEIEKYQDTLICSEF